MSLSALAVFAFALLVTAGTPGPSVAALVARVLTNGVRTCCRFSPRCGSAKRCG